MSDEAKRARKKMLSDLRRIVQLCECEWPLVKYRNRHGHSPDCPVVSDKDADD